MLNLNIKVIVFIFYLIQIKHHTTHTHIPHERSRSWGGVSDDNLRSHNQVTAKESDTLKQHHQREDIVVERNWTRSGRNGEEKRKEYTLLGLHHSTIQKDPKGFVGSCSWNMAYRDHTPPKRELRGVLTFHCAKTRSLLLRTVAECLP